MASTYFIDGQTLIQATWLNDVNSLVYSGGAAVVAWGGVTGTLSNQTDLQAALNAKASTTTPTFSGKVTFANSISLNGAEGTTGQMLTSVGIGAIPTWTTPTVSSGMVTTITGLLKGSASVLTAATVRTDYAEPTTGLATGILKNTTGTGAHTIATGADLPVMTATVGGAVPTPPNNTTTYLRGDGTFAAPAGSGTVTTASVVSTNGFTGTVANPTTTPAITLTTSITGLLKGNGTALSAVVSGTDIKTINSASILGSGDLVVSGTTNDFGNRIINGDMRIDQRNLGVAVTPPSGLTYIMDRWAAIVNVASKLSVQQVVDAPAGFKYSTKILVLTQYAAAAGEQFEFHQCIEGQNIIDFNLGTASAAAFVVSFWAKASVAGTYSVALQNGLVNRSYISTVSLTTSWARYSIALTGDTTGTWATDSTQGLYLFFNLGSGTTWQSTANTWQAGRFLATSGSVQLVNQTAGATLNITGVQLELGSVANTFKQRPIDVELSLCKRYYQILTDNVNYFAPFNAPAASNYVTTIPLSVFAVPMRVAPTITSTWGTLSNVTGNPSVNVDAYSWSVYSTATTSGYGFVYLGTQKASAEL